VIELGRVFADDEVASLYAYRAPYPPATFAILERLVVGPRAVLDAGAGTGAIARNLPRSIERIDAVDPSAAMIARGRALPNGDDPRIRWILGRAEDAPLSPPYGLITAGASLHWMRPEVVLPRFRDALAPGAHLAILNTEKTDSGPWRAQLLEVIQRYSPVKDHLEVAEMVARDAKKGLFTVVGEERTPPVIDDKSVDDFMRLLGSTSTLSRATLGARADAFDAECREMFARNGMTSVRSEIVGYVAWVKLT
jgi:SAM-dependent methyltransferase